MAYTTIDDPSAYFHTQLYTGDGNSGRAVTNDANVNLQPDWVWIKKRAGGTVRSHNLYDSSRGATQLLNSDGNGAEFSQTAGLTAFGTDGFTLGTDDGVNGNTHSYLAWQWKANGGTTASNTDGTITSTVQANTTAGFSIILYTATGSNATIGHGLSKAPELIITKGRSDGHSWLVGSTADSPDLSKVLVLNRTDASATSTGVYQGVAPTSSVYSIGTSGGTNSTGLGGLYVAYAFHSVQGYSKIGTYTGNANADGPFVYTGFKTKWLMTKRLNNTGSWTIFDNTLDDNTSGKYGNPNTQFVQANNNNAEATTGANFIDFLSNGFKCRGTDTGTNGNGDTYVYMAFAESPFVSSEGVPTTAR